MGQHIFEHQSELVGLGEQAYFIILVACIFLLVWMPRKIRRSSLDNAVKRLHESYASGFMQMETWFTEEGIAMGHEQGHPDAGAVGHVGPFDGRVIHVIASGFMQMETWFTEEGIAMHNLTDGAQLVLAYGSIRMVKETERYFYLLTKANQFTLVFKNSFG